MPVSLKEVHKMFQMSMRTKLDRCDELRILCFSNKDGWDKLIDVMELAVVPRPGYYDNLKKDGDFAAHVKNHLNSVLPETDFVRIEPVDRSGR